YPTINVIGLDISQQLTKTMPKNFTFVQANVLKGIPFENNTFDFVFQRFMAGGYTKENWPYVMNEIVRVLKPDDGSFTNYNVGPVTRRFWNAQSTFVKQQGIDLNVYQTLEIYPQNQGQLENIKKEVKQIRQGVNSNDIQLNEMAINNLILLIARMKPFAVKILRVSDDEFDELLKKAEKELYESDFYYNMARVYANKGVDNT
ncbi:19198_t:CDS:2, partial [Gigaspora margarita]